VRTSSIIRSFKFREAKESRYFCIEKKREQKKGDGYTKPESKTEIGRKDSGDPGKYPLLQSEGTR